MKGPETELIRIEALPYCIGNGVDLGYGGNKIVQSAISLDTTDCPFEDCNYKGDARKLPFGDYVFDYVYSSHLLEDFEDTKDVLIEWIRVLKDGGFLILYLPIQKIYASMASDGVGNTSHKVDMSLEYIMNTVSGLRLDVIKRIDSHGAYSFFLVFKKVS
jgi:SAM-dependent methyltransferase